MATLFKNIYLALSRFRAVRGVREWVRENIQMRYWPWYDWKPWGCGVEKNPNAYKHELIVSLTSFPARIHIVGYAIRSLLRQSLKPNRVVLWLGEDKFPRKDADLPKELLALEKYGLEIHWARDIGPHTKLIHSLRAWPEAILVTADDDQHYPHHWLRTLYQSYLTDERCIHSSVVHEIQFDAEGKPEPYEKWVEVYPAKCPSFRNFLQGAWGVVYPPHCLHPDVLDEKALACISPTNDDYWFWAMAVRNGTKIARVQENRFLLQSNMNPRAKKTPKLWERNTLSDGNVRCQTNILQAYPEIEDKLKAECSIPG